MRVSQRREGVVADVQLARGDVLVAGDGEVPGEVEVRATDPCAAQCREDRLEAGALGVDRAVVRGKLVAVVAEALRRGIGWPARVLQVAQGDDVAVPGGEVDRRVDLEGGGRRGARVRVDLDPDRLSLAGRRVDHHDGRVGLRVAAQVVDRSCARSAASAAAVSSPGTLRTIPCPGLKPSLRQVGARGRSGCRPRWPASPPRGSRFVCPWPSRDRAVV